MTMIPVHCNYKPLSEIVNQGFCFKLVPLSEVTSKNLASQCSV